MALTDFFSGVGDVVGDLLPMSGLGIFANTIGNNLGIFSNVTSAPVAGAIGGIANALLVPQNTAGLGIFSNILNPNPVASVTGKVGSQLVSGPVQLTNGNVTGVVPIGSTAMALAKQFGVPVATPASKVQAQSLTISGAVKEAQTKIDQVQGDDSTLLYLGGGLVLLKLMKII